MITTILFIVVVVKTELRAAAQFQAVSFVGFYNKIWPYIHGTYSHTGELFI